MSARKRHALALPVALALITLVLAIRASAKTTTAKPKPTTWTASQIQSLITKTLDAYLAVGKFIGPPGPQGQQGPQGQAGASVSTYPANPSANSNGGSIAGFSQLSASNLSVDQATATKTLNVSGNASVTGGITAGSLSTAGTINATNYLQNGAPLTAGASPAGSAGCIQYYLDATHFGGCDPNHRFSLGNFNNDLVFGPDITPYRDFALPQDGLFVGGGAGGDITSYSLVNGLNPYTQAEFNTSFFNIAAPAGMQAVEAHSMGTVASLQDDGTIAPGYYWYLQDDINNNNFDLVVSPTNFTLKSDMYSCWSSAIGSFPMPVEDTCLRRSAPGVVEINNGTPGTLGQLNLGTANATAYSVAGVSGLNRTINLKGSDGNNCTETITHGIITASTCP